MYCQIKTFILKLLVVSTITGNGFLKVDCYSLDFFLLFATVVQISVTRVFTAVHASLFFKISWQRAIIKMRTIISRNIIVITFNKSLTRNLTEGLGC